MAGGEERKDARLGVLEARGTGALGLPLWAYALLEGERQKSEVSSG